MRLLLVDDDADTLDLERLVLEGAGASVECAITVEEALAEHRRRPVDMIVSDLAMPGQDGFDLARLVRLLQPDELSVRVPLLALSAHASATTREQALAAGFDRFLTKPVHPDVLVESVAAMVRLARGPGGS